MHFPDVTSSTPSQLPSRPSLGYWKGLDYHVRLLENQDAIGLNRYFDYLKAMDHDLSELMSGTDKKAFSNLKTEDACFYVLLKHLPEFCFFLKAAPAEGEKNRALAEQVYQDPRRLFRMEETEVKSALHSLTQEELELVFNLLPGVMKERQVTPDQFISVLRAIPKTPAALAAGVRLVCSSQQDCPLPSEPPPNEAEIVKDMFELCMACGLAVPIRLFSFPLPVREVRLFLLKECPGSPAFSYVLQRYPEWHDDEEMVRCLLPHYAGRSTLRHENALPEYVEFLKEYHGLDKVKALLGGVAKEMAIKACHDGHLRNFGWLLSWCADHGIDLAGQIKGTQGDFSGFVEEAWLDFALVKELDSRLVEGDRTQLLQAVCDRLEQKGFERHHPDLIPLVELAQERGVDFSAWKMNQFMDACHWNDLFFYQCDGVPKWTLVLRMFSDESWWEWFNSPDFERWERRLVSNHPLKPIVRDHRQNLKERFAPEPTPEVPSTPKSDKEEGQERAPSVKPKPTRWKSFKNLFTRK